MNDKVKGERMNMELEELFRSKLENAEFVPSAAVRRSLMKKVAVKEFMHFNPVRFNIYYLGGLAAAGIAAALLLFTGADGRKSGKTGPEPQKTEIISDTIIIEEKGKEVDRPISTEEPAGRADGREGRVVRDSKAITGQNSLRNALPEQSGGDSLNRKEITVSIGDRGVQANLMKNPSASFRMSPVEGCVPLKIRFINNSSFYDSCRWIFGDGGSSSQISPEWIFDNPGTYRVTLNVYTSSGASSTASEIITVYPRPEARFEIQAPDQPSEDGTLQMINYSSGAIRYRLDFGDGTSSTAFEPLHSYQRTGTYNIKLVAWSEHGCTDTVTILNVTGRTDYFIRFPNAFMPNRNGPTGGYYTVSSDASAHIFHPVANGVDEYQLRIFSRSGMLIFESNDINIGWDGYNKGNLCEPGVYIWKARGKFKNGETFVKMGDVTLLRGN